MAILVFSAPTPDTFLLNERFLTMAIGAAAWLAAFFFAQQSDCELGPAETQMYYFLAIAANFCFLLALSMDVWDLFGRASVGIDRSLAQELALSVLWIVYAFVLLVVGVLRKEAAVRWQGLGLLCVAIVKVFFFDLSFLDTPLQDHFGLRAGACAARCVIFLPEARESAQGIVTGKLR